MYVVIVVSWDFCKYLDISILLLLSRSSLELWSCDTKIHDLRTLLTACNGQGQLNFAYFISQLDILDSIFQTWSWGCFLFFTLLWNPVNDVHKDFLCFINTVFSEIPPMLQPFFKFSYNFSSSVSVQEYWISKTISWRRM